jgi:hypothetical protein
MNRHMTRREVLVSAAALGFASSVEAQTVPPLMQEKGSAYGVMHEAEVARLSNVLGNSSPASKGGCQKILDALEKSGFITKEEEGLLLKMLDAIFAAGTTVERLRADLQALAKEASEAVNNLAAAIVHIASRSLESAIKLVERIDIKRVVAIVASDVSGALTGAAACEKFGKYYAVVAAVAGAVSSSVSAVKTPA